MTRDFVKAGLLAILGWLAVGAKATTTKVDDKAVEVGMAIVEEEVLFDWFFSRASSTDGTLNLEGPPTPEVQAVLQRRNIDLTKLIEVATTLITLFRMFRG